MKPDKPINIDIGARLEEAINAQRDRIYKYRMMREPPARDFNDALKVMSVLIQQARAYAKDAVKFSKSLSPEKRGEVIVSWFETLPLQQQRLLLDDLQKTFALKTV